MGWRSSRVLGRRLKKISEQLVDENRNQEVCPAHSCERETGERAKRPKSHGDLPIFLFGILDSEIETHARKQECKGRQDTDNKEKQVIEHVVYTGCCDGEPALSKLTRPPCCSTSRAEVSCMRRAPQLGVALQGLPFLRRRAILGHRGLHERLERARVDLLPFVDVDRSSRVAFQAGIEEARWVWDPGPPGERELHDLRVRLPGADKSVVRPDRDPRHRIRRLPPFPLLDHLGVGFENQRPHAGQGLAAPSPQVADPLVDEPGSGFPGRSLTTSLWF